MNDGTPEAPSDESSRGGCLQADLAPQSRTRGVTFLPHQMTYEGTAKAFISILLWGMVAKVSPLSLLSKLLQRLSRGQWLLRLWQTRALHQGTDDASVYLRFQGYVTGRGTRPFEHNVCDIVHSLPPVNQAPHCILPVRCEPHLSSQDCLT